MIAFDEIRRHLCSDKSTMRKKGKLFCESHIFRVQPHLVTTELVLAVMDYEILELKQNKTKIKSSVDVAIFVRRMIGLCVTLGNFDGQKNFLIFEHVLRILYNDTLPLNYKYEHKMLLCEVLIPKQVHSISFECNEGFGMCNLFYYLKENMIDAKTVCDAANLKLVQSLCRTLNSLNHFFSVLKYIMQWFDEILHISADDDKVCNVVAAVCDCYTSLMKYYEANICTLVYESSELLLQAIILQFASVNIREIHRTAYFRFLKMILNISAIDTKAGFVSILPCVLFRKRVTQICMVLCGDDFLRSVPFGGAVIKPSFTREILSRNVTEPLFNLAYDVISAIVLTPYVVTDHLRPSGQTAKNIFKCLVQWHVNGGCALREVEALG